MPIAAICKRVTPILAVVALSLAGCSNPDAERADQLAMAKASAERAEAAAKRAEAAAEKASREIAAISAEPVDQAIANPPVEDAERDGTVTENGE